MSGSEIGSAPGLRPLYRATFQVAPRIVLGSGPTGTRIMVPITGGSFAGERLSGEVQPGGADWQLVRPDGVVEVDARYVFKTNDAALIAVHNVGILHAPPEVLGQLVRREDPHPSRYYMRMQPRFRTSSPAYAWLERVIAVATGEVRARSGCVVIDVFDVE